MAVTTRPSSRFKRVHKIALDRDTDIDAMARITTAGAP